MPHHDLLSHSPLGRTTDYGDSYNPDLLFPISRLEARRQIGIQDNLPFKGADLWSAYELSWLNPKGKPQIALAHFSFPCTSPNIIESKSFKLYLNSLNNTPFDNADAVKDTMRKDLSKAAGSEICLNLILPEDFGNQIIQPLEGICLDHLDISCRHYTPAPELLQTNESADIVEETLTSDLLKSNCPVTGQPDWGSIRISYKGRPINHESLLQYIVSFRNKNEFHEQCVERIFMDIRMQCKPRELTVFARYTRRGGLDINPWRSNIETAQEPAFSRHARQ